MEDEVELGKSMRGESVPSFFDVSPSPHRLPVPLALGYENQHNVRLPGLCGRLFRVFSASAENFTPDPLALVSSTIDFAPVALQTYRETPAAAAHLLDAAERACAASRRSPGVTELPGACETLAICGRIFRAAREDASPPASTDDVDAALFACSQWQAAPHMRERSALNLISVAVNVFPNLRYASFDYGDLPLPILTSLFESCLNLLVFLFNGRIRPSSRASAVYGPSGLNQGLAALMRQFTWPPAQHYFRGKISIQEEATANAGATSKAPAMVLPATPVHFGSEPFFACSQLGSSMLGAWGQRGGVKVSFGVGQQLMDDDNSLMRLPHR
ncbi:hypothetical protein BDK51DRAFT_42483 [Blyttiomyces helicus]|uniref:Uncharacterized protein n=1 Tax=Blyttiomyces helicus TaxID=388810 RepID=A0A4P9WM44_9FUNG|nr:hypothetical protein BDK51DRAFT_42483 [Blyttiomyces helicus]|eukprot:RKO93275.1 hypothetical protein BDK51DRAFT_42483 [Blyttiomyces helicus]